VGEDLWDAYDKMGLSFQQHAADSAFNAHYIDQAMFGEPLPYPDGVFDLIVCALAIHYASDRAAAFAEFCRVLRPGGRRWYRHSTR
jgi:SAM-dependent methyltransferase